MDQLSGGGSVYVFDCGLNRRTRDAIQSRYRALQWKRPGEFEGLPPPSVGSYATYARLNIGVEFAEFSRVLYLDADTVVTRSLKELEHVDLGANDVIAACVEPYTPTFAAQNGIVDFATLGFGGDEPYFNAGVMLVRPNRWRDARITEKAIAYLRHEDVQITLYDQEALNVALFGRWKELPPNWNVSRYWLKEGRRAAYPDILDSARIVHFLSEEKPWSTPQTLHPWLVARYNEFASSSGDLL